MANYRHWSLSVLVARPRRRPTLSNPVPTKLNGGLSRLHSADEDTVSWLTSDQLWFITCIREKEVQRKVMMFKNTNLRENIFPLKVNYFSVYIILSLSFSKFRKLKLSVSCQFSNEWVWCHHIIMLPWFRQVSSQNSILVSKLQFSTSSLSAEIGPLCFVGI